MESLVKGIFAMVFEVIKGIVIIVGSLIAFFAGKTDEFAKAVDDFQKREREQKEHEARMAAYKAQQKAHSHGFGHQVMHKVAEQGVHHLMKHFLK